jgi:hypothetical protein
MTRFLPDGQTIRQTVRRIFSEEKRRRVALVAFVGGNAQAYLPRPRGLQLVCWPQAPGTDPATVKFLLKRKVNVCFSKRLHMKVYWTQSRGAVVASANLSTNAYGAGALHEAGVFLPSSSIDIDALLKSVAPYEVTNAALKKLKVAARRAIRNPRERPEKTSFLDWCNSPKRRKWVFFGIDSYGTGASQRLRAVAKELTGSSKVFDFVYCMRGDLEQEDFALIVDVGAAKRPLISGWLYVHRIVLVDRRDRHYDKDCPFQAAQLFKDSVCPAAPFHIDSAFRRAMRAAYQELGKSAESVFTTGNPSKILLERLKKHYIAQIRI